jgi:5-(carboxyamino)imidazole ribonucleotide synthase
MTPSPQEQRRLGILGGGQLAKMLCDAARRLGLDPVVFAENMTDPAAQVAVKTCLGKLNDRTALARFFAEVDLAIIESEFVDCDLLDQMPRGPTGEAKIFPSTSVIRRLQDKIEQKRVLEAAHVPTSPWMRKPLHQSWSEWLAEIFPAGRTKRLVLKWARLGYDGKGTLLDDGSPTHAERATAWCLDAERRGIEVFAEDQIRFKSEVAIVAAHSVTGESVSWPVVISRQRNGVCEEVVGPATRFGVSSAVEEKAKKYAAAVARSSGLCGVFAIEFFLGENDQLLVNEIAPRVHNSGHWSMDGAAAGQFENHWRAVLGMPLGATTGAGWFSMLNLLGPAGVSGPAHGLAPKPVPGVFVHWYGKAELRPGRKMGHLNIFAGDQKEFEARVADMKRCHTNWTHEIEKQLKRNSN